MRLYTIKRESFCEWVCVLSVDFVSVLLQSVSEPQGPLLGRIASCFHRNETHALHRCP